MNKLFRTLPSILLAAIGLSVAAQDNMLIVSGHMNPCDPSMLDSPVSIVVYGSSASQVYTTTLNENCYYHLELPITDTYGVVRAGAHCISNNWVADSTDFTIIPPNPTEITLDLDCSQVLPCEVSFLASQVAPFSVLLTGSRSGGVSPWTFTWTSSDGQSSTGPAATFQYDTPGTHPVTVILTDGGGCQTEHSAGVLVHMDGSITLQGGAECSANYLVGQGYTTDPISGDTIPAANELWAWNLSTNITTSSFHWDFGDGTSSDETYPTHIYPSAGPFVLCLTVSNNGCTSTYCDSLGVDDDGVIRDGGGFTLSVREQASTGISENTKLFDITLFPNPVTDELNISLQSMFKGSVAIELIDINGRLVSSSAHVLSTSNNLLKTSVSTLSPGLYTVRVSNGSGQMTQRFIKTR